MKECNCDLRDGDAKTAVFGSNEMLQPAPVDTIPMEPTTPQIAYQMVKDETFAQTQPRLNLATGSIQSFFYWLGLGLFIILP